MLLHRQTPTFLYFAPSPLAAEEQPQQRAPGCQGGGAGTACPALPRRPRERPDPPRPRQTCPGAGHRAPIVTGPRPPGHCSVAPIQRLGPGKPGRTGQHRQGPRPQQLSGAPAVLAPAVPAGGPRSAPHEPRTHRRHLRHPLRPCWDRGQGAPRRPRLREARGSFHSLGASRPLLLLLLLLFLLLLFFFLLRCYYYRRRRSLLLRSADRSLLAQPNLSPGSHHRLGPAARPSHVTRGGEAAPPGRSAATPALQGRGLRCSACPPQRPGRALLWRGAFLPPSRPPFAVFPPRQVPHGAAPQRRGP